MNQSTQRRVQPAFVDHRQARRKQAPSKVIVFDAADGRPVGELGNITPAGLMMVCHESAGEGAMLQLRFQIPLGQDEDVSLVLDAVCKWCITLSTGRVWSGFEFTDVPGEQRDKLGELCGFL